MEPGNSPPRQFHGYRSDGEPVESEVSGSGATRQQHGGTQQRARLLATRTRKSYADSGKEFIPESLAAPTRKKSFRPRSNTDPLAPVPEDAVLERPESLDWDRFGENAPLELVRPLDGTRRWSTDTLFSVPAAHSSLAGDDGDRSDDSEDYLSPNDDETPARQVTAPEMSSSNQTPPDAALYMRKVKRALMEAEEDVIPFAGKRLTLNCITKLCTLAASLKKDLQVTHLELDGNEEYQQQLSEKATACRQKLTAFLVDAEESRERLEAEERERVDQAGGAAGAAAAAASTARQPIVVRKVKATVEEATAVAKLFEGVMVSDPSNDAELYEKVEKLRILDERAAAVNQDSYELSKLILEAQPTC
jgi:hypothetical protein